MPDPVQLTDLDVITRYSIAVRKATADRDELIATLRSDLTWLERGLRRTRLVPPDADVDVDVDDEPSDDVDVVDEVDPAPESAPRRAPIRRMPVKVTPTRRAATKKTATKKTAAKKTAAKPAAKKTAARRSAG